MPGAAIELPCARLGATGRTVRPHSIQLLRLDPDVLLAGGLLLLVLFDPGFPAFAGGGVAAGELEAGDVAVTDGALLFVRPWEEPGHAVVESRGIAAGGVEGSLASGAGP